MAPQPPTQGLGSHGASQPERLTPRSRGLLAHGRPPRHAICPERGNPQPSQKARAAYNERILGVENASAKWSVWSTISGRITLRIGSEGEEPSATMDGA